MDPPSSRKAGQAQQAPPAGFPSPVQDHARVNPKFIDDCTRMNFAIQQSLPEAVRRIVRDHWEKCLLGSEFHQAFILNAAIHHATPSITQRAVRDFGRKMVAESKHELIGHFTPTDIDQVADLIISKASDDFLDKCLEKRLMTIEAKPLINALAKAERLGYDPSDMVEVDPHERVIPQEAYPGATTAVAGYQAPGSQPPPAYQAQNPLQCMKCFRTFTHSSAFDYHMRYNVCSQLPPTTKGFDHSCPHCGQGFTSVDDLQSHLAGMVCGNFGQAPKPSRGPGRPPRTAPAPHGSPIPILPSMSQSPTTNGYSASQLQSTPAHPTPARRPAAATPGSAASSIPADPYAHLTEHQLRLMNEELQAAEAKYAPRFAEAEKIPDENLRRMRIEGLRNSFGTKQSMIRKKYGVRLRERRTKAEIMAERQRLGIKRAERDKGRASIGPQQQHASSQATSTSEAASRPTGGSGWTAANTPRANAVWEEHDAKRRRLDESGGYQTPHRSGADETPSRKALSVSEIGGGLSGASATAATHDPTLPPPFDQPLKVYYKAGARIEIHDLRPPAEKAAEPTSMIKSEPGSGSTTPHGLEHAGGTNGNGPEQGGTTSAAAPEQPAVDPDDESSGDDEDIPPTLPAQARKNSAPGSSGGGGTGTSSLLQTS